MRPRFIDETFLSPFEAGFVINQHTKLPLFLHVRCCSSSGNFSGEFCQTLTTVLDNQSTIACVLPSWIETISNYFDLELSEFIVREKSEILEVSSLEVGLQYIGFLCKSSWTDSIFLSSELSSNISKSGIITSWPSGIPISVVRNFLSTCLTKRPLSFSALFCVEFLNVHLIFHITSLLGAHVDKALYSSSNVSVSSIAIESSTPVLGSSLEGKLRENNYLRSFRKDIIHCIFDYISSFHGFSLSLMPQFSNFPSRYLLSGPEGCGKSFLLKELSCIFAGKMSTASFFLSAANPSCSNYSLSSSKPESMSMTEKLSFKSFLETIMRPLIHLCSSHPNDDLKQILDLEISGKNSIMIVIDDLDSFFDFFSHRINENVDQQTSFTSEEENNWLTLASYLDMLNLFSSDPQCPFPLIVVGATRRSCHQLPLSNTGCPNLFDKTWEFPKPTLDDRQYLVNELLVASALPLASLCDSMDSKASLRSHCCETKAHSEWSLVDEYSFRLAHLTGGYLAEDIVRLIQKCNSLYQGSLLAQSNLNHNSQTSSDSSTSDMASRQSSLSWKTCLAAVAMTPPRQLTKLQQLSIGAEIWSERKSQTWKDFAGYEDIKVNLQSLIARISCFDSQKLEKMKALGITSPGKGIVLYGPSGCGKTMLASIIGCEMNMNLIRIRSTELLSKYYGDTEKAIRTIFQFARHASPCLLFFDEFDVLACRRSNAAESLSGNLFARVLSTFLNEMDGITTSSGLDPNGMNSIIVLVACANIQDLDEALLRPGRLHHHIELRMPTRNDIFDMLSNRLVFQGKSQNNGSMNCDDNVKIDVLANLLSFSKATGADFDGICKEASLNAIRTFIKSNKGKDKDAPYPKVCWSDFLHALTVRYPSLQIWD